MCTQVYIWQCQQPALWLVIPWNGYENFTIASDTFLCFIVLLGYLKSEEMKTRHAQKLASNEKSAFNLSYPNETLCKWLSGDYLHQFL